MKIKFRATAKRWWRFKVWLKEKIFKVSLCINLVFVWLYLHEHGYLTEIYKDVARMVGSILTTITLPH